MIGKTISHYKVLDKLGSGGMGVVYRVEDTRLGREAALKCLPPDVASDPQMVERLVREARSASSLNHPNICTIYEVDEADGYHFITMELLQGQTLRDRIAAGPMPLGEFVRVGIQIADALSAAHKKNIIHRDIKPANVFLNERSEAKVLDFGLAKVEEASAVTAMGVTALTSSGQTVGTIAYMSPEQARGLKLDSRSDLFSLGVLFYEMVTGELPFPGGTTAIIFDSILNRKPVPISQLKPGLPNAVETIVGKLLEKDCKTRYQLAAEVVADLRRIQVDGNTLRTAPTKVATPRKAGKTIDSLAVLPFTNATGNKELDYLSEMVAEGVLDGLSHLPKLRVVPRSKAFRHRADDPYAVGRELAVRAVLSGRITMRDDMLSIRAELIDVAKDTQLWGSQFSCTVKEVGGAQDEITRGVTSRLTAPSTTAGKRNSRKSEPAIAGAAVNDPYELFTQGNSQVVQWVSEGLQSGIEFYRQAVELDPQFAPAHACMAIAYAMLPVVGRVNPGEAFGHARTAARRAIELDESFSEAHAALSITEALSDFNLGEALFEADRALVLNPDSAIAHYAAAQSLAACGRLDEAREHAIEGCAIDPQMAPINYLYGIVLYYQRRWDDAAMQLERTLEINPRFLMARAMLAIALARSGSFSEALATIRQVLRESPDPGWELMMAYVAALAGQPETAEAVLARVNAGLMVDSAYLSATIYGALGDLDRGFAELERARDLGFAALATGAVDPALEPFRDDFRWDPFWRGVGELAQTIRELQGTQ
jgi:serine/threonine protein kinase/tetratricopeptide (TPR) repeat protein